MLLLTALALPLLCAAHKDAWSATYSSEGTKPATPIMYGGFNSFAHLPHYHDGCLGNSSLTFDLAVLGAPFDTLVSFRPGARFGPYAIRSGSRRQRPQRGYHPELRINPYEAGIKWLDCGDVPMSSYDPLLAIDQLQVAYDSLISRPIHTESEVRKIDGLSKDGLKHPRLITMGGDHTIVLPILRSLSSVYGPISVIHLDAHLDTWEPLGIPSETHGTFFHAAAEEGLMGPSIHLGIRTRLSGTDEHDYRHSSMLGFDLITTDALDEMGAVGVAKAVKERVGDNPVYISLDIDVVDPAFAPATGTAESGGWTSREVKRILRGFEGLNIVGADIVEVSPAYDTNAEITAILAADLVHEFGSIMVAGDKKYAARLGKERGKDEL
ncbi:arginase family-domain-containing protein [Leucosporidium creatinivorum]|uniref:Arginase family-domain-containing protein n=1 Tax=Leucosporidium creatinivorum TaxID=106004 RepID=A0A1Y2FXU9_9BASI|nr:arginase family-domain-containing protein [Leucosporidium creatinivorum]